MLESYRNYQRNWQKVAEHRPELNGMEWKLLETTRIVQVMSWLAPTLTHITMRNPVISGAKDRAVSALLWPWWAVVPRRRVMTSLILGTRGHRVARDNMGKSRGQPSPELYDT